MLVFKFLMDGVSEIRVIYDDGAERIYRGRGLRKFQKDFLPSSVESVPSYAHNSSYHLAGGIDYKVQPEGNIKDIAKQMELEAGIKFE